MATRNAGDPAVATPVSEHGDDYALSRVPKSARYHWFSVCVQRFGQLSCLS
ncbi:MAG: hypothetical protein QOI90_3647, partial [Mycobacterium sp.]|nr:hypothetical protein [Mycobacterium sp.]